MKKYIVENGHTRWSAYDNRKDAEDMARHLNRKYKNGYYVVEVKHATESRFTEEEKEK